MVVTRNVGFAARTSSRSRDDERRRISGHAHVDGAAEAQRQRNVNGRRRGLAQVVLGVRGHAHDLVNALVVDVAEARFERPADRRLAAKVSRARTPR